MTFQWALVLRPITSHCIPVVPEEAPGLEVTHKSICSLASGVASIHRAPHPRVMALAQSIFLLILFAPFTGVLILLRRLVRQWTLRKIPGPPNASLLAGAWPREADWLFSNLVLGNFAQFFSPTALGYQDQLTTAYGRVFRLNGYLGVRIFVGFSVRYWS